MEKLEKQILGILSEDCRAGAEQIATMLGEDAAAVKNAIRDMERRGTIVKYAAISNLDEEEDECVQALIEVKVTPQSGSGFDGIASEIAQHGEVKNLYLMSGAYDFAVIVESNSVKAVSRFISECISTFECVLSTATHFILKKYKIEGALTGREKNRRISVQA
jgi:DNA-binding Lrp family transcriptional regulator